MHDRASNRRDDPHGVGEPRPPDGFLLRHLAEETRSRARTSPAAGSTVSGADAGLLEALRDAVAGLGPSLVAASHDLSAHPEVGFAEHRSAAALADAVESHGVDVVRGAHGLDTALRAEVGDPAGPTVACSRSTTRCPASATAAATTSSPPPASARSWPWPPSATGCPAGWSGSGPRPRRAAAARS